MMGILSGAAPLIVDVRQTGSGPLQVVGTAVTALGVDPPAWVGLALLIVVWLATWRIWQLRTRRDPHERKHIWAPGTLGVTQRVFASFCLALFLIGNVVVTLDISGDLDRTEVSATRVAASVVIVGLVSVIGGRLAVPRLDGSNPARLMESYRSRFFARLAWAEAPSLLALGAFFLLGGEAWVYGIGLAASLVGFALAAPTRAAALKDQAALTETGRSLDLLETLLGTSPSRGPLANPED